MSEDQHKPTCTKCEDRGYITPREGLNIPCPCGILPFLPTPKELKDCKVITYLNAPEGPSRPMKGSGDILTQWQHIMTDVHMLSIKAEQEASERAEPSAALLRELERRTGYIAARCKLVADFLEARRIPLRPAMTLVPDSNGDNTKESGDHPSP